jgi:hypothetical protein
MDNNAEGEEAARGEKKRVQVKINGGFKGSSKKDPRLGDVCPCP